MVEWKEEKIETVLMSWSVQTENQCKPAEDLENFIKEYDDNERHK